MWCFAEFEDAVVRVTPTNHESEPTNDFISSRDTVCVSNTCSNDLRNFFDYSYDVSDEEQGDIVTKKSVNQIVDLPSIVTAIQSRMSCSQCVMKDMNSFLIFC
jgi:hypothetical protein